MFVFLPEMKAHRLPPDLRGKNSYIPCYQLGIIKPGHFQLIFSTLSLANSFKQISPLMTELINSPSPRLELGWPNPQAEVLPNEPSLLVSDT